MVDGVDEGASRAGAAGQVYARMKSNVRTALTGGDRNVGYER